MMFAFSRKRLRPRRFAVQVALLGVGVILTAEAGYTLYMSNEHADFAAQIVAAQSRALAGNIAAGAAANVAGGDLDRVEQLLMQSMSSPDVRSLHVLAPHGRVLAGADRDAGGAARPRFGGSFPPPPDASQREASPHADVSHTGAPHGGASPEAASLPGTRTVWQPIRAATLLGWVRVEYGLDSVRAVRRHVLHDNLVAGLTALALSMAVLLAFLRRPLRELRQATEFASRLDRCKGERIPVAHSNAELAMLTTALNDVSACLHRQETELRSARDEALAASAAKGEFIANVSHEIRTPMNAILGMTQIALDAADDAERRAVVVKISRSANLLLRLINDILDFSKIEAGRLQVEYVPFAVDDLVDGLAGMFAPTLQERGIELMFDVAAELRGRALTGDPLRLHQILQNMIGNAAKFTEHGEIVVRLELAAADGDGATCLASVADTGIGIPADRLHDLFQPFVQADGSITRRFGGTGLGLAICRRIVEAMGGEVGVDSRPGEGSRFWFTVRLPYAETHRAVAVLPPLRVLVADGNATARVILPSLCRAVGLEAVAVADGDAALAAVAAGCGGQPWDLAMLAYGTPGVDGIETARRLHALSPSLPLILMAGRSVVVAEAAAVGIRTVLEKPLTPSLLVDAVREAVGIERAAAPLKTRCRREGDVRAHFLHLQGRRVLLVEDNDVNQEVALHFLRRAGLAVDVANHGGEALDMLAVADYDIVLMDGQMQVMDGYEATRRIRAGGRHAALPIVALTADAGPDGRARSLAAGMNDQVDKPIEVDSLYRTLARWLNAPTGGASTAAVLPPGAVACEELPTNAAPDESAVDFAAALQRLGDDENLYREVVEMFLDDWRGPFGERLLAAQESAAARRLAHTLKGAAATVGANALRQCARALEVSLRDHPSADVVVDEVERELARACGELRRFLTAGAM